MFAFPLDAFCLCTGSGADNSTLSGGVKRGSRFRRAVFCRAGATVLRPGHGGVAFLPAFRPTTLLARQSLRSLAALVARPSPDSSLMHPLGGARLPALLTPLQCLCL